jgi:hypothetical protein
MSIRKASTVQDGHTLAQQAIYSAMWNNAQEVLTDSRIYQGGLGRLATLAGLHPRTVARNIPVLIRNLSVEVIQKADCREHLGTTYQVYGYSKILLRRKEAGLVAIASRGNFVTGPTVLEAYRDGQGTSATLVKFGKPSATDVEKLGVLLDRVVGQLGAPLAPPNQKTLINLLNGARNFNSEATPEDVALFISYKIKENPARFQSWGLAVVLVRDEFGRLQRHVR